MFYDKDVKNCKNTVELILAGQYKHAKLGAELDNSGTPAC
jgi:hypothetical protein